MITTRWGVGVAAALWAASGDSAWAQSKLDAETLKVYGGTYSVDCSNPTATRLRVVADALMVEQGNKRLTGNNVQAAHSFFGQSPPANYLVALLSEVRGGSQLLFIVFKDRSGQYITLDGDQKINAALGKSLLAQKFRSCDPAKNQVAAAPPVSRPPSTTPQSDAMIGPPELLNDAKFKSAYYKALGSKVKESWLTTLDGPAPPIKKIKVAGAEYLFASACKNHDCADNNTVLLYSAAQGIVYGKVVQQRRASLMGAPPPAVAAELERLWLSEWRQK